MPIYEYICLDCDKRFEALRPMKDADALIACEKCLSVHTARCVTVCFAHGDAKTTAGSGGGCAGCAGGSCATCH
jgi:putative FmdB family regulatory protein